MALLFNGWARVCDAALRGPRDQQPLMVTVPVLAPFQVALNGTVYGPGSVVEAPDDVAQQWISHGWAQEQKPEPPPGEGSAEETTDVTPAMRGQTTPHRNLAPRPPRLPQCSAAVSSHRSRRSGRFRLLSAIKPLG